MIRYLFSHIRAIAAAGLSALLFYTLFRYTTPLFFGASLVVWVVFVLLIIRPYVVLRSIKWELALSTMAYVSTVSLMSIIEWRPLQLLLGILGALTSGVLIDILFSNTEETPVYIKKAFRRIRAMAWVFVYASIMVTLYAYSFFFPNIPLALFFLIVGVASSTISYAIWCMYYDVPVRRFSVWLIIMAVMSMEVFWTIQLLPFGYMVLGFLASWAWYLVLLLMRFHMSSEGIRWTAQRRFLLLNAALLLLLLLFVIRWI